MADPHDEYLWDQYPLLRPGAVEDEIDRIGKEFGEGVRKIMAETPLFDEETGWLIERLDTNAWFCIEPGPLYGRIAESWTKCSTSALRFARQIDAENAIRWLAIPPDWFAVAATEHSWSDRASPSPASGG